MSIDTLRQSAALLLAHSVCALFPRTLILKLEKTGSGFSCTFRTPQKIDKEVLLQIEEKMRQTIFEDLPFQVMEMMRENAATFLEHHKMSALADQLKKSDEPIVKIVRFSGFYAPLDDVVESSKEVGFVKLLESIENNGVICITGAVYPNQQQLKKFLKRWNRYKEVNHQKLGREYALFFEEGGWNWLPRGCTLLEILIDWWKQEHQKQGFSMVRGDPLKMRAQGSKFCLLNTVNGEHCPSLIKNAPFTGDSAYIFCSPKEVPEELTSSLQFFKKTGNMFGFDIHWCVVASQGDKKKFDPLVEALEMEGLDYTVEKPNADKATPKIMGMVVDLLEQEWPAFSLKLDRGVITRELFGSIERVAALLVEKYAGQFPLWLAPEQVCLIPVKRTHDAYAQKVREKIVEAGGRVEYLLSEEKLSSKVHAAIQKGIPYLVIVGEEEIKMDRITVRSRNREEPARSITLEEFLDELGEVIKREKTV